MNIVSVKTQVQASRVFESITRQWEGLDRINDGVMIVDESAVSYIASYVMSKIPSYSPVVEMKSLLNSSEYLSAEDQCEILQSEQYCDDVETIILKDFNVIEIRGMVGDSVEDEKRIHLEVKFLCDRGVEYLWSRTVGYNLISQEYYSRLDKVTKDIKKSGVCDSSQEYYSRLVKVTKGVKDSIICEFNSFGL